MTPTLWRAVTLSASCVVASVLAVAACTHTTDRAVVPAGDADASAPTPELSDGGVSPIGPIANTMDPADDFHLVRSPELGSTVRYDEPSVLQTPGFGGASGNGGGGMAGSDRRPVAAGGSYF